MKKIVFILSILLLPLTTYAQTEVSDNVIQKAANDLKPALCKNDLKKAIQIVKECYEHTDALNINKADQCVLEDFTVNGLVQMKRTKAAANGQPEPYADIDFVNPDSLQNRMIKYRNSYTYLNKSSEVAKKKVYNDTMRVALALHKDNCFNPDNIH